MRAISLLAYKEMEEDSIESVSTSKGTVIKKWHGLSSVGKYKIINKIGAGTEAVVFSACETMGRKEVALKLSRVPQHNTFPAEFKAYTCLKGLSCVPKVYSFCYYEDYALIIMELLGPSIGTHLTDMNFGRETFSAYIVAKIGRKLVRHLMKIHEKGIVHGDVKPSNILVGKKNTRKIYLIDFGSSLQFKDKVIGHFPVHRVPTFIGTPSFASLNAHRFRSLSRRDDMISVAYTLFYFLMGSLPWSRYGGFQDRRLEEIESSKEQFQCDYFAKHVHKNFVKFFDHALHLRYEEKPDYLYLLHLLREVYFVYSMEPNHKYDWHMMQPICTDSDSIE